MKRRRFLYSLSGRLTLLFIGMTLLLLLVLGNSIGRVLRDHFQLTLQPHLQQYLEYIRADIGAPPDLARAEALSRELPLTIEIAGPGGVWTSGNPTADFGASSPRAGARSDARRHWACERCAKEYLTVRDGLYTYTFSVPIVSPERRLWLPLGALLLVLVVLYYATRALFRPIDGIHAGIERIGAGELDHRLDVPRRDELGDLARSINGMADEIRRMLEAKRQLLLAISHELRSPLTRAKVAVALLGDAAQRAEITRELDELAQLIEELLETERLSSPHRALDKRPASLNALVDEVLENFFAGRAVQRRLPVQEVRVEVDAPRIKLLLKNLLDNALRHTPAGAPPPEVTLEQVPSGVTLTVRDHGTGIASEHVPHLTEPFYRADPSRRRETGGYGLGLYLCRVIAEAHGSALAIDSAPGRGTSVRVSFPHPTVATTETAASAQ